MAENIAYKLSLGYVDDWLSLDRIEIRTPSLRTPFRYCTTCRIHPYAECGELPMSPSPSIVELLKPYQGEKPVDLLCQMDDAIRAGDHARAEALNEEYERFNALSPQEFSALTGVIRHHMGLAESFLILPWKAVGPPSVILSQELEVDIVAGVAYACTSILTERASELLLESGLTGFQVFPMTVLAPQDIRLYTLVVTGDGGIPRITSGHGEWRRCPGCSEWWLYGGNDPVFQTLDQDQWDGSDFFHLAHRGDVYISERAQRWFQESSLRLLFEIGRRLDWRPFHPDLPRRTVSVKPTLPPFC